MSSWKLTNSTIQKATRKVFTYNKSSSIHISLIPKTRPWNEIKTSRWNSRFPQHLWNYVPAQSLGTPRDTPKITPFLPRTLLLNTPKDTVLPPRNPSLMQTYLYGLLGSVLLSRLSSPWRFHRGPDILAWPQHPSCCLLSPHSLKREEIKRHFTWKLWAEITSKLVNLV